MAIKHLMLDFETLATSPTSVVLSLGAVIFNNDAIIDGRLWNFDLEGQFRARREVNAETLFWWMNQGEKAKEVFGLCKIEGIAVKDFLPQFFEFINSEPKGELHVWGNGANFDVAIIENLITTLGHKIPWKFWNVRCYRTLKNVYDIEREITKTGTKHNALDDATNQAKAVQNYLQKNPGVKL